MRRLSFLTHKSLRIVIILLIIGLAAAAFYFYRQYDQIKKNPNAQAQEEIKRVTRVISKFISLPADEEPSLATITDIEKLKDQPFFKGAKNGDKLIIYNKTAKAILYRPSENKIIDFTLLDTSSAVNAKSTKTSETVRVALYNGTATEGLTKTAEGRLSPQPGLTIVEKVNAGKKDYEKTLVVAISSAKREAANQIASYLNAQVGELPAGEKAPGNADILVILGNDFK